MENFKRWQMKMKFYLTTLRVVGWITSNKPVTLEGELKPARSYPDKWWHKDYMCKNYILNCLSPDLYDVYATCETENDLWNALDKKYGIENAGTEKFVVGKFLEYKMEDNKYVVSQVDKLQIIIHEILAEGYNICEGFQVSSIIAKLSSSWKGYKNGLKHKRKEMSMQDLTMQIYIEENNRKSGQKEKFAERNSKENLVEGKPRGEHRSYSQKHGHKPRNHKYKLSIKKVYEQKSHSKTQFKAKASSNCFVCGKINYFAKECKHKKTSAPIKNQANMTEEGNFYAVVTEVNLVSNKTYWQVNSRATKHICCIEVHSLHSLMLMMENFCIWVTLPPSRWKGKEQSI